MKSSCPKDKVYVCVCVHICSSPFRLRRFYLPYHMLPPAEYDFFHRWTKNKWFSFFFGLRIVDYLFFLYVWTAKRRKEEGEARRQIWIRRTTQSAFFSLQFPPTALEMHFSTFKCCLKVHSDFSSLEQRALGDGLSLGVRRALPRPHPKSYSRAPCQRFAVQKMVAVQGARLIFCFLD